MDVLSTFSIDDIALIVQKANDAYFNKGKPILSDQLYDKIKAHLETIDPDHPILKSVGAAVDATEKIRLPYWMGSMDKIKSDDQSIDKWSKKYQSQVVISDKLDGNSALLHVDKGQVKLYSRGNGHEGRDISHLIAFVKGIPKGVAGLETLTVRGELIIPKSEFRNDFGKNPRNTVAGVLNAKTPNLRIAKLVHFVAYELIVPHNLVPSKGLAYMASKGFEVVEHRSLLLSKLNADTLSTVLAERRTESPYEVDGIVVVHDQVHARIAGENPKHAFAFKSMAMMNYAEVIVTGVEWNLSKDAYLKPVVTFDGVNLGGVVVKRATGNNGKFIHDRKIGPGATIVVTRSGDVIPAITGVIQGADKAAMPTDIAWKWNQTGIDIVADADFEKELAFKNMEFFFAKIKVSGLSTGILRKLYQSGYDTVGKVLKMNKDELASLDGFQQKSAEKLVSNLKARMAAVDDLLLIAASNTMGRGIGEKKIQAIVAVYPSIVSDDSYIPAKEDLIKVNGIQANTAEKFIEGLHIWRRFKIANGLVSSGQKQTKAKVKTHSKVFENMSFVFTGVRSKQAEQFILDRGGSIKSSLSSKTDFVICKDPNSHSSKVVKAREMGVKVVTLEEFALQHGFSIK